MNIERLSILYSKYQQRACKRFKVDTCLFIIKLAIITESYCSLYIVEGKAACLLPTNYTFKTLTWNER